MSCVSCTFVGIVRFRLTFIFYRWTLESIGILDRRRSVLEEDFEEEEEKEENDQPVEGQEDGTYENVFSLPFLTRSFIPFYFFL